MEKSTIWSHKQKENCQKLSHFWQQLVDLRSLGWRLTVEIGTILTIALTIITAWNSWQMQNILIASHTQNIAQIADRFPRDVKIYSEMIPLDTGIKKTIDNVINPKLLIWVKDLQGRLISHSDNFQPELPANRELISLATMPQQPQMYQLGNRYLVLCEGSINIQDRHIGTVYLAQDVTDDRQRLTNTIFNSIGVGLLVMVLMLCAIAWRVRYSLSPLARMNQTIGELNLDRLQGIQLQLGNLPSEIQSLAQTFNMILSQLAESWEHQRQLVSNVSHELRTPLTIILGYLQSLLRRSTNLTEHQREALTTATAETERTVRLLQDLLDLARADSGYLHFYLEPVCLDELALEVAAIAKQISDREIVVNTRDRVMAIADRDRLKQVLINIVDNGIKYSPPDRPIGLNVSYHNRRATIQVRDRGIGISPQDVYRVFERFYRVDEARSRSTGGHGLGLAISQTLIEGMGGTITLESQPQQGSTFTISLPIAQK